jgi:hypothetical protein
MMSLLARVLLVPAALSLLSTASIAKEIKGAPKELIGAFGRSAAECRSYNRNAENITMFFKSKGDYFRSQCLGRQCSDRILSYKTTRSGFVLTLLHEGEFYNPPQRLIVTRNGRSGFVFQEENDPPTSFIRCKLQDVIAGIGLQPESTLGIYDGDYKVYYALAIPKLCPTLEADVDRASKRLGMSKVPDVEERILWDVERDMREIPGFCKEVLGSFGPKGRVIQDMLRKSQRKN